MDKKLPTNKNIGLKNTNFPERRKKVFQLRLKYTTASLQYLGDSAQVPISIF